MSAVLVGKCLKGGRCKANGMHGAARGVAPQVPHSTPRGRPWYAPTGESGVTVTQTRTSVGNTRAEAGERSEREEDTVHSTTLCTHHSPSMTSLRTSLRCPDDVITGKSDVIFIKRALYGHSVIGQCAISHDDCVEEATFSDYLTRCMAQETCVIPTIPRRLQVCGLLSSYLRIEFLCMPVEEPMINICESQHRSTSAAGYITSPDYPSKYPANANCACTLTAPTNTAIHFRLIDIRMEVTHDCRHDYVEIVTMDGSGNATNVRKRFCHREDRSHYLETVMSQSQIRFRSDKAIQFPGIWIAYYAVPIDGHFARRNTDIDIACNYEEKSLHSTALTTGSTAAGNKIKASRIPPGSDRLHVSSLSTVPIGSSTTASRVVPDEMIGGAVVNGTTTGRPTELRTNIRVVVGLCCAGILLLAVVSIIGVVIFRRKVKGRALDNSQWTTNSQSFPQVGFSNTEAMYEYSLPQNPTQTPRTYQSRLPGEDAGGNLRYESLVNENTGGYINVDYCTVTPSSGQHENHLYDYIAPMCSCTGRHGELCKNKEHT